MFDHNVVGFIFVKKVPRELYIDVLNRGPLCDEYLSSCRLEEVLRKHGLEEIADITKKMEKEFESAYLEMKLGMKRMIREELRKAVRSELANILREIEMLKEIISELIKVGRKPPEVLEKLKEMPDIIDIEQVSGKILIFVKPEKVDKIAEYVEGLGLKVVEKKKVGKVGVVKAVKE